MIILWQYFKITLKATLLITMIIISSQRFILWFTTQVKKYGPVPAGKRRKSLEHGSSIPFGFFPIISGRFLPEITGSWQESTGKNPDDFRPEYCFHFRCFPAGSDGFLTSFLQDPAGSGGRNLRLGKLVEIKQHLVSLFQLGFFNLEIILFRSRRVLDTKLTMSNERNLRILLKSAQQDCYTLYYFVESLFFHSKELV